MNRHYRLPLRTRPKNVSTTVRRRRSLPALLKIGLITFGGIVALFAIGLAAFFVYRHFSHKTVRVAAAPSPSVSPVPMATPTVGTTDVLRPLSDPNQVGSPAPTATVATGPHEPSTSGLTPVPAPTSGASVSQLEQKTDAAAGTPAKTSTKTVRKSLEKKRQAAERKRAHLELMHQNHEISTTDYNKGEQEYKDEIQKYRKEINPDGPQ
jgi:hypothetical protein